jgi:type VI secretion system secreted protein Hcp
MAFDTFLSIDGLVDDTTTADGHPGQIQVYSFAWGASNPVTIGAGGTGGPSRGKVSFSSFNFMKKADKVSPALMLACASGSHFKSASVTLFRAAGSATKGATTPFVEYDFTDVVVESIQWSGSSGGDDIPSESVSLAFAKVVYKSTSLNPDGTTTANPPVGWDLAANQKI